MILGRNLQVCTILSTSYIIFVCNRSNFVIRRFISMLKTILLCAFDTSSDYKNVDELSAYHKKNPLFQTPQGRKNIVDKTTLGKVKRHIIHCLSIRSFRRITGSTRC